MLFELIIPYLGMFSGFLDWTGLNLDQDVWDALLFWLS